MRPHRPQKNAVYAVYGEKPVVTAFFALRSMTPSLRSMLRSMGAT